MATKMTTCTGCGFTQPDHDEPTFKKHDCEAVLDDAHAEGLHMETPHAGCVACRIVTPALRLADALARAAEDAARAQVWLVIERSEDEGTDWAITIGVYSSEEKAEAAVTAIEARHVLSGPGEWCECHRADWRAEGPFLLDSEAKEAAAVPTLSRRKRAALRARVEA